MTSAPPAGRRRPTALSTDPTTPAKTINISTFDNVLPAPFHTYATPGVMHLLSDETAILVTDEAAAVAVAEQLAGVLRHLTGHRLPVLPVATPAGRVNHSLRWLVLTDRPTQLTPEPAIADEPLPTGHTADEPESAENTVNSATLHESYRLDVRAEKIMLQAHHDAGLFYGAQTLCQLLPPQAATCPGQPGTWAVPGGRIIDRPRFAYRGAMLDVARHFFDVATVERYLDELAKYKINHLHLHLTDDQGWRIAINSWPRLTTISGASQVGGGPGGYYTQEQYRHLVAYAAARHITIVPEIDIPGHINAALAAYGELTPEGVAPPPYTGTEVGSSALRPDHEPIYGFIRDVLTELAALTPGPYLHIGGDEAFKLSAAEYATFLARVQPIVAATGKTVLGWHQIAAGPHHPGRIVQYWGTDTADKSVADAVRQGARVLLSPANRAYLDMRYDEHTPLGLHWAGNIELRQAYDWDPGNYLADVPAAAVLGVEAPLWTETVTSLADLEFMAFPRLAAIAELGWSPRSALDWEAFRQRLAAQGPRWEAAGVNFYRTPQVAWPTPDIPAPRTADHDRVSPDPADPEPAS